MQMTDLEIVASYRRNRNKNQIDVLAQLNACGKENIREILIKNGIPEDELPKKRGPKPKKQELPVVEEPEVQEEDTAPVLEDDLPFGLDIEEPQNDPVMEIDLGFVETCELSAYRPISLILATGVKNDEEADRVERYNAIPDAVKALCRAEIAKLHEEILALEAKKDILIDFMNGEVVN